MGKSLRVIIRQIVKGEEGENILNTVHILE